MTNHEIRIAVAKACGRSVILCPIHHSYECCGRSFPDYPNDLNACVEFEKTLTNDEQPQYFRELCPDEWKWIDHNALPLLCFATARQRCEAFLRVKGLWKDHP